MAKNQKYYTPEFKQQIVDLYNARGTSYPQLEREYGVNRSTISGWVKQLSPIRVSEDETVTLKEYKALQKALSFSNTGDPGTITITCDLLSDQDDNILDLTLIEE